MTNIGKPQEEVIAIPSEWPQEPKPKPEPEKRPQPEKEPVPAGR